MAYETGTAEDYLDFTDKLRKFVCGYGTHDIPIPSGVGNGLIGFFSYERKDYRVGTHPETITETWTMTVTDVSVVGSEVWAVVGSVSGIQTTAVTGVAYDNPFIGFQIDAGTTNYQLGDTWVVDTTQGQMTTTGQRWTQLYDDGYQGGTADKFIILKGTGESGDDNIYLALRPYANTSADYHNLLVYGMTGLIDSPREFINSTYETVPMWNASIPYWITANGRRFIISTKISTVYTAGYFGLFLPYATPAQYPYPLCIIGNDESPTRRWSDVEANYRAPFEAGYQTCRMVRPDNTWLEVNNKTSYGTNEGSYDTYDLLWPCCYGGPGNWPHRENLDGSRTLFPYIFMTRANGTNTYGELDGCGWVTGFGTLSSEDEIIIDGVTHVVFQSVHRTSWNNYWALRME